MIMGHHNGMDHSPQHRDHLLDGSHNPVKARVVVGIDGSDTSWDAFCWACGETNRLGGSTVAVFVGPTPGAASATAAASFTGAAVPYGAIQQSMTDQAEKLSDQVRAGRSRPWCRCRVRPDPGGHSQRAPADSQRRPRRSARRWALHQSSAPHCWFAGSAARRKTRGTDRRCRALT